MAIARSDTRRTAEPAGVCAESAERAGTRGRGGREHGAATADAMRAADFGREWSDGSGGCIFVTDSD